MIYGSVCSGIEAATIAWEPLGWKPKFFSEIEKFPSEVLAHHYGSNMPGEPPAKNGIPNYGDFTKIGTDAGPVDLLVGGTPCQSFSVAGKRLGLDDPRGNLALEYLALARRLGARWIVWENVPGVLSSFSVDPQDESGVRRGLENLQAGDEWDESSDFATFLAFVRECGYGFAYRVLDAQYVRVDGFGRAVPQRRRRVFLVGYLGDWRRAAAALLEPEGMRGDPAPRRKAGQKPAPTIASRPTGGGGLGTDFDLDGRLIADDVSHCLNAGSMGRQDWETESFVARTVLAKANDSLAEDLDSYAFKASHYTRGKDGGPSNVTPPISAEADRGDQDILIAFDCKGTEVQNQTDGVHPPLRSMGHHKSHGNAGGHAAIAIQERAVSEGPHDTANMRAANGGSSRSYIAETWAVRRLTPLECERLQGFPDNYTAIPRKGKPACDCPDGPRYKAFGNSMAVNVMRWIGRRIEMVERLDRDQL